MSVLNVLNQIKQGEIVLPAIQRNFVWREEQVQMLLDSIMRGYPIGIALMWETYEDIQYRGFQKHYSSDALERFEENGKRKRLKVVLDGQQRLQSLYLALYGTYKGKELYFDVLSGIHDEDFKEERFLFYFMKSAEATECNSETEKYISEVGDCQYDLDEMEYLIRVKDVFGMDARARKSWKNDVVKKLGLNEEDELRVETNIDTFNDVLSRDENILKTSVIDENQPHDSPSRKTESDVLEVFVRINRQGTLLNRSDLIFSMLKLGWRESAEALPDFVKKVNEGNSFNLDNDFVIRCLFAVSDLGTRFNVDLLRSRSNLEKIRDNFDKCCKAIKAVVDFVQSECWVSSSKIIGGYNTLVPFVYYAFWLPRHQIPTDEIESVRKAFYLFAFTSPFSRYADSRLGKLIRETLKPRREKNDKAFPFKGSVRLVTYWERLSDFRTDLIERNPMLALSLVQRRSGAKTHFPANAPEIDHIFPKSELRNKDFDDSEINLVANYWILSKGRNQNKSAKHPKIYFKDMSDADLKRALIDREMLDYRRYRAFVKSRQEAITRTIQKILNLEEADILLGRTEASGN